MLNENMFVTYGVGRTCDYRAIILCKEFVMTPALGDLIKDYVVKQPPRIPSDTLVTEMLLLYRKDQ